ncbi:hypothetical protein CVT24_007507 [Panaeolus cyanescens]|uniref:CxC1-like cysteine cluster associated with KDZ transposases domain-containing protein n=1 Tax=Panaeolus cyanescens TaxID=181874 RepID=A0A409WL92_9AGAR|nr:hypothetical protein CVT24_007507 [Panaeolus cyanescens]
MSKQSVSRGVRGHILPDLKAAALQANSSGKRPSSPDRPLMGLNSLNQHRNDTEKRRKVIQDEMTEDQKDILKAVHGRTDNLRELDEASNQADPDGAHDIDPNVEWVDVNDEMDPVSVAKIVDAAVVDPKWSQRYVRDTRSWKQRSTRVEQNWAPQLQELTEAYLRWTYPKPTPTPTKPQELTPDTDSMDTDPNNVEQDKHQYDFEITAVNLYTLETKTLIQRRADQTTSTALMEAGYLGNSPINPSLALSVKTLQLYLTIRQRKPSFSFEAMAKVLCDLYQIPYRRHWRSALADAFDVFLAIKRNVDRLVQKELGRDTEHWRALNACPPSESDNYEYKQLEEETPLKYRVLLAIDGNDSTKRMGPVGLRQVADGRVYECDYFIPNEEVNQWTLSDVRAAKGPEVPEDDDGDDNLWEDEDDDEKIPNASPDGVDTKVSECVRNWKAAQSDSKKRTMGMFEETGWFAGGCRHGLIFWVADMIRSGEQAKYGLSFINRALSTLGPRLLIGYDIGCSFQKTIQSTTLGDKFVESGSRCCVNAYHGYAHNFPCQTANHPNNLEGCGIEDLETMERFFSLSNALAPVIRYASRFRRRQFLHLFLQQNDWDKYAALGVMLRNNYKQALDIIKDLVPVLERVVEQLGITTDDLDQWQQEQAHYFATLGKEPEENVFRVTYVELLKELQEAEQAVTAKNRGFLNAAPDDYDINAGGKTYGSELSETRRLESQRKHARDKRERVEIEVLEMEQRLGIATRWNPSMEEYTNTVKYIAERKYQRALDKLQKLVVQRLFELHRLNMSGVGYRARSLLAKAMKSRSRAIQNAVNQFNHAAQQLQPPRNPIDWQQLAKYNFVEEFNLLRHTARDIREEKWANDGVREAMKMHQRIKRAREELLRLNVEICRLYTSIANEKHVFRKVLDRLFKANQVQHYGAVELYCCRRVQVNNMIVSYLLEIQRLDGYTGPKSLLGKRKGAVDDSMDQDTDSSTSDSDDDSDGDAANNSDDDEMVQVGGIVDFIADLSTI